MPDSNPPLSALIPKHGGYRNLKTFQIAQLVYDLTVTFCDTYINRRSRTHDQMVQAARSGVQNIAEGSLASATSKKFELKLTSVARASLEELRLDYQDYLRQRGLREWPRDDARREDLVTSRPRTAADIAAWIAQVVAAAGSPNGGTGERGGRDGSLGQLGQSGLGGQDKPVLSATSALSTGSTPSPRSDEAAANAALVLINVASALLARQINSLALAFESQGGFTERLYNVRRGRRNV